MSPPRCYDQEHAHTLDDCGSMYCDLTGREWSEWAVIDETPCDDCPYAASYEDLEEEEYDDNR